MKTIRTIDPTIPATARFRGKGLICREIAIHLENLAYLDGLRAPARVKQYDQDSIAALEAELEQLARGNRAMVGA